MGRRSGSNGPKVLALAVGGMPNEVTAIAAQIKAAPLNNEKGGPIIHRADRLIGPSASQHAEPSNSKSCQRSNSAWFGHGRSGLMELEMAIGLGDLKSVAVVTSARRTTLQ